jgi:hypothetical protein
MIEASLSRLMIATQRVGKKYDMRAIKKEGSLWLDLQKAVVKTNDLMLLWLTLDIDLISSKAQHRTYHRVHYGSST